MENIIIYNNDFKIKVAEEVFKYKNYSKDDLLDFFQYAGYEFERYNYSKDLEGFKEACNDYVMEHAEDRLSIFNHHILEDFKRLDHWEIDDIVDNSGWIEYNPKDGFINFARMVIVERNAQKLYEDIEDILEHAEVVEFEREDMEKIKNDIINHLENYRDTYIEGLAEKFKNHNSLNAVEAINEYICEMSYCSYQAVGDEPYLKGWDIYEYYYIDLYLDKDIQKAILEY